MNFRSALFIRSIPFLLFALLFSGCAAVPVTDEELAKVGADVNKNMIAQYGEYRDPALNSYVEGIGRRVEATSDYAGKPLQFTVLDTQLVNAFSVPGGYIFVTRGLLSRVNSESELAFVIGHEIGHLTERHAAQRISQVMTSNIFSTFLGAFIGIYSNDAKLGNLVSNIVDFSSVLVILSYGRDAEFEADKLGADFEYRARYNPLGGVNFFVTLKDIEGSKGERASLVDLLATHPPTADRIDRSKDEANELLAKAKEGGKNLEVERAAYLKRMDGMVLGDSLDAGFVKDDKYSNKKYMFVLRKPSDWKIITARSYLAGLYRDKNNFFLTYAKVLEPDQSLTEYARQFLKEAFDDKDFEPQFKSTTYRDMSALDFYVKRSREVRALFFARNKVNYALVYSYVGQPFVDQDEVFNTLSKTFDFMTKEEADKILEDKLRIYTAVAKDTSESISVKFYQSPSYKDRLMEYNGLIPPIVIGTMFKIPPAKYLDEDKEEK